MTFTIKRGDTSPAIAYALLDSSGQRKDISGYNDVRFFMRDNDTLNVIVSGSVSGDVEIIDAAEGEVRYDWQNGDTDEAGSFEAEWEVEYGDGTVETFPNSDYIDVEIREDIE